LIQTILKCATLGGQLLEKNREHELTRTADNASGARPGAGSTRPAFVAAASVLRPSLTSRSITAAGETLTGGLESPALVSGAEQDDPLSRARSNLSEPNIHLAR
jgi:osomolarity two-component system sensor histidine kinase NIK1